MRKKPELVEIMSEVIMQQSSLTQYPVVSECCIILWLKVMLWVTLLDCGSLAALLPCLDLEVHLPVTHTFDYEILSPPNWWICHFFKKWWWNGFASCCLGKWCVYSTALNTTFPLRTCSYIWLWSPPLQTDEFVISLSWMVKWLCQLPFGKVMWLCSTTALLWMPPSPYLHVHTYDYEVLPSKLMNLSFLYHEWWNGFASCHLGKWCDCVVQ